MKKQKPAKETAEKESVFRAAKGAPFSDEDAAVIGAELVKIAEDNRTDVRSLDERLVWEKVKADPHHPMRRFYDLDKDAAAEAHWIAHTAVLIRGIRVVTVLMKPRGEMRVPLFTYVPPKDHARLVDDAGAHRRKRVLTEDVLASDPDFGSALSEQIRLVRLAVRKYQHTVKMRKSPRLYSALAAALGAALDEFDAAGEESRAAAE